MKLITIITTRGRGNQIMKDCEKLHLVEGVTLLGKGTAPSEILDKLLLGDTNKDVIFSITDSKYVEEIFNFLEEKYQFTSKGRGIAFAIPLSSVTGKTKELIFNELKGEK